jgi:acetyl-CoA carboxylase carboxyltransferase component
MDKLKLLQARKAQLFEAGKGIREEINQIIDKDSFVELSTFSFSKNDFYGEDAEGEGVVTGFATIDGYPFYIVAQNSAVLNGGVSKANCQKINKCLEQAERNAYPIIYILSSLGVQIGEGVNVLEGLAGLILQVSRLKGEVPQYLVVDGEVYGQISVLAGLCDFVFFIDKKSVLAANSPLVISAESGKNLAKENVGGATAATNAQLASFVVKDLAQVKENILKLTNLTAESVVDCENLNTTLSALNTKVDGKALMNVFDKGSSIEVGATYSPEVKCVLGRIGGIAVAAVIFDGEGGVKLNSQNVKKLISFADFACCHSLPYVTFVNTLGISADLTTNNSTVLKDIGEYVSVLDCMDEAKISVVYGKAIGLGYTIFAAKSMGYDFTYAFANARIALFDSVQGAEIEFKKDVKADKTALESKYADENSDPVNAAKGGFIDNIIEPAFVKQYLIASLQMLLK